MFWKSFDPNRNLVYVNSKTPVIQGFFRAHFNHYPIRIKPDDIWLLIVQAFSNHVNTNSKKLREMSFDFDGKKTLIVSYPLSSINQINESIIVDFTGQINSQLNNYLGDNL